MKQRINNITSVDTGVSSTGCSLLSPTPCRSASSACCTVWCFVDFVRGRALQDHRQRRQRRRVPEVSEVGESEKSKDGLIHLAKSRSHRRRTIRRRWVEDVWPRADDLRRRDELLGSLLSLSSSSPPTGFRFRSVTCHVTHVHQSPNNPTMAKVWTD